MKTWTPEAAKESVVSALQTEDKALLVSRLAEIEEELRKLSDRAYSEEHRTLMLEMARTQVGLEEGEQAWAVARPLFDEFASAEDWEHAVDACDVLFRSAQEGSLSALGQGIWLAVTFPLDPELTIAMLQHVIEETPDDADGAAVAAATAAYLTDIRTEGKQHEKLSFFTNQLFGQVARRHSDIESQAQFDFWLEKLELNDPEKFLPRLRNVVDVLVQDDWWIDREAIQAGLPD